MNMVVLRAHSTGALTFKAFLAAVRGTVLSAIEHQDYPLALLVARLQPVRDPSRSPLFQALFALQKFERSKAALADFMAASDSTTQLDFARPQAGTIPDGAAGGAVRSRTRNGRGKRIARRHVQIQFGFVRRRDDRACGRSLSDVARKYRADPNRRVSDLPFLTEPERHQLLMDWNDTKRDYPVGATYPELFEAQAERTPDAVAVVFEERQLTYRRAKCPGQSTRALS